MAESFHQKLAKALAQAQAVAINHIIKSSNLSPADADLLIKKGFLKKIIRGWYLLDADHQAQDAGNSVLWQESYRAFLGQYLSENFGAEYHLSPEDSLDIHTGRPTQPSDLIVYVEMDTRRLLELPGGLVLRTLKRPQKYYACIPVEVEGLRILSLADALILSVPTWFRQQPLEVELALSMVNQQALAKSAVKLANLQGVGRVIGAYQAMGVTTEAEHLQYIMEKAGFDKIKYEINNPLENKIYFKFPCLPKSPYAGRIQAIWESMREDIIQIFPPPPKLKPIQAVLHQIDDLYLHDAYHSLSIEGYRVTPELIAKIQSGSWNPQDQDDKQQIDALAAKGYEQAFTEVKLTITKISEMGRLNELMKELPRWYGALFGPCVQAGIIRPEDLAGYRNRPVYIRGSKHVPLPSYALPDAMDALFLAMAKEENPAVSAVLGHFLIGYIHPYPDGNGRMARFLMNTLFTTSGYPWTIIRVEDRRGYMSSLEQASCEGRIDAFAKFILKAMNYQWKDN